MEMARITHSLCGSVTKLQAIPLMFRHQTRSLSQGCSPQNVLFIESSSFRERVSAACLGSEGGMGQGTMCSSLAQGFQGCPVDGTSKNGGCSRLGMERFPLAPGKSASSLFEKFRGRRGALRHHVPPTFCSFCFRPHLIRRRAASDRAILATVLVALGVRSMYVRSTVQQWDGLNIAMDDVCQNAGR